jgi:membrane dipeptidase
MFVCQLIKLADTISFMIPIFDGHNDTLLSLYTKERGEKGFFDKSDKGHIDYPRAKKGGFAGGFFAVYASAPGDPLDKMMRGNFDIPLPAPVSLEPALKAALDMAALLFRIERQSKGKLKVVRKAKDLQQNLDAGVMSAIFHIEGAEMIDRDLNTLEVLYQAGLRSIGPVWSRQNIFGTGVPFSYPKSPDIGYGLSGAGKAMIKACNELGIMIDLSHMNEKGFWDVAKLSNKPLVATHSNVHAICPSARNLTDKQLDAIAESDGMVGLNFAVIFLNEDGQRNPDCSLDTMVKHIDYLVAKLGIDRVGFGSDYDGAQVPNAIKDVTGLPKLIKALKKHGYDEASLKKIGHQNWFRVLKKTWNS